MRTNLARAAAGRLEVSATSRWRGVARAPCSGDMAPTLAPPPVLARFVRSIRVVSRAPEPTPWVRLPDGELDLIVRLSGAHDIYAIGTRTRALSKGADELPVGIAVRFRAAGAYPFFGVPVSELTDRVVALERLWGRDGARLRERVATARTPAAALGAVEDALAARLRRDDVFEPASARTVRRAVRLITESPELPRVDALARTLGVSERQLRRSFDEVVGVGPKAFARIERFQRALRASREDDAPAWGAIARRFGYSDQSHLIAEFRALTGTTPGALVDDARTRGAG